LRRTGKRKVDSAAGERKLDCPGGVAELLPANLKAIQVLIAPAERDLQGRVEFGQTRLFSDQQSASHRRRYTAEALSCTAPTFRLASIGAT
jgi:hypothetical protein